MVSERAIRCSVLVFCFLLPFFQGAPSGAAAVRFDVVGSPTEVIHTGRSEVLGSVNFIVRGAGNVTGSASGGASQIGLTFSNPPLEIDNTDSSGIKLFYSAGFASAPPSILHIENIELNGRCAGFISLNFPAGATLSEGDYVRLEGIRGRIDAGASSLPGSDFFVDLQSVNDPAAMSFTPDRLRVAKSLKGLSVELAQGPLGFDIVIKEGFSRAFVDVDASNDGVNSNDRTDNGGDALGLPTNSTQVTVALFGIADGVADVVWPLSATNPATGASLRLLSSSFAGETSAATYSFEAVDQAGSSDLVLETFYISPGLVRGPGRCNTDDLTASATLAPAVPRSVGCGPPSPVGPRPRFLEIYEPVITSLSPTVATVSGDAFTLTVYGAGFTAGSLVRWNGAVRPTAYVSFNGLQAEISAADIARTGSASVSVSQPAESGGSVSNAVTFDIVPHPLSLFFPHLATAAGGAEEFTGMALANISGRIARLRLTALDESGAEIQGPDISNPVAITINAHEQSPFIASEAFGAGVSSVPAGGWVKVEGNVQQVVGFFLSFDASMSRLEGADVSSRALKALVFPEIDASGFNQLRLTNPNPDAVTVTLELMRSDGAERVAPLLRSIPGGGVMIQQLGELFPGTGYESSDYVRIRASDAVVPLQYFGGSGDQAALNGQDVAAGSRTLYSPQYVVGGGKWSSTLSLINLSATSGTVSLRFLTDQGEPIGATRITPIEPAGKLHITDQDYFIPTGDELLQGYLEILSDVRLTGSVVFKELGGNGFAAALPLVSTLRGQMVFSQVASDELFYTGLSLLNPGDSAAGALIQVFDQRGKVVSSKVETVPARGRRAGLLTEFFPELNGMVIRSGYILVYSPVRGLAGFALFGTNGNSVLSAIPAQILP